VEWFDLALRAEPIERGVPRYWKSRETALKSWTVKRTTM
jgi:hypothetical protein